MLYPSQQQTADLLAQRLGENRGAVVLQGISGTGKSHIAEEALKGGPESLIMDVGMTERRTEELRQAVARQCRLVILAHPLSSLDRLQQTVAVHPETVQVRGLSKPEVTAWLDATQPELSAEERSLVMTYSLGLPLMIERLLTHRPLTHATALSLSAACLQNIVNQYPGGEDRSITVARVLQEHTDFTAPEDALALVGQQEGFGASFSTPIGLLQTRLKQGAEMPVPATLQLYALYQEWLTAHFNEPNFEVLVQSMPDAEQFLEQIGYSEFGHFGECELRRFTMANARKGSTFYPKDQNGVLQQQMNNNDDSLDPWMHEHMLVLARSSGIEAKARRTEVFGREVVQIEMPGSPSPLFLHKHDHSPLDVMPVAYTVECALQARGVSYTVSYNGKLFRYDAEKKAYEPAERVKVDYFREAYGDLWTDEDDSPNYTETPSDE